MIRVVGAAVPLVLLVEAGLVAVERVGVLHHELARAQDAGARARLVALLDLELVEEERQVAVGADVVRHVVGRAPPRASSRGRAASPCGRRASSAPRSRSGPVACQSPAGWSTGTRTSWPPIAFISSRTIADHVLDHAMPGGEPGPKPGAELAHEARADHQLVRDRLGVRGVVAEGRHEVSAEARHGSAEPTRASLGALRRG